MDTMRIQSSPFFYKSEIFLYSISLVTITCTIYAIYQRNRVISWIRDFYIYLSDNNINHSKKDLQESSNTKNYSKIQSRLLLITCAAMYGSNFVSTKYIQKTISPSLTTTIRFLIGCIFFLPKVLMFRGDLRVFFYSAEIGMWWAIGFNTQSVTLQYTSASKNAFITALSVVILPMLDIFFNKNEENASVKNDIEEEHKLLPYESGYNGGGTSDISKPSHNKKLTILIPSALALLGVGMPYRHICIFGFSY
jgi:hypothetical protein